MPMLAQVDVALLEASPVTDLVEVPRYAFFFSCH